MLLGAFARECRSAFSIRSFEFCRSTNSLSWHLRYLPKCIFIYCNDVASLHQIVFFILWNKNDQLLCQMYDCMMENSDMPIPSTSSGGRPYHSSWDGYEKMYVRGRLAAKCTNCLHQLTNSSQARLVAHRKKCVFVKSEGDNAYSHTIMNISSTVGGRPYHSSWDGYEKIYVRGRITAKCTNCLHQFRNTSQTRLLAHRKKCVFVKSEGDNAFSDMVMETNTTVGGRPYHNSWDGYEKIYVRGRITAKCTHCLHQLTNTSQTRLIAHRKKCVFANSEGDNAFSDMVMDTNTSVDDNYATAADNQVVIKNEATSPWSFSTGSAPNSPLFECTASSTPCSFRSNSPLSTTHKLFQCPSKQPKVSRFMDRMSAAENAKLDELVAEFFYGCNVPFVACDSIYFKKLVNSLCPAYTPPNSKKLATTLLNTLYDKIDQKNKDTLSLKNKITTLLIDGWNNSNGNNVVTVLATTEDQKIFLESFDISNDAKTSDHLVDMVMKSVNLAKERFNAEICAVVSKNARNMACVESMLPSTLFYTTCNAHTGHLLANDFVAIKKYADILNKVMTVQQDFKKPKLEARLVKAGGNKAVLYSVIRFSSSRNAIKSFLNNLPYMAKVAADDHVVSGDGEGDVDVMAIKPAPAVTQLLFNENFIESAKNMLEIMEKIAELINVCEKSTSSIADAVEMWLKLLENAPNDLQTLANDRCKTSNIFNDVTLTANFLHPIYRGQKLSTDQKDQIEDYILQKFDANTLESFRLFSSGEGIFATLNNKIITSPKTYWYYANRQHKQLANFATKLLLIPASTVQLEQLFSNWSLVHNEIKNRRLSEDSSKKLMNIYFSMRTKDYNNEMDNDDNEIDQNI